MTTSLTKLNEKIITCRQCPRLVNFRKKIATEKRRQYMNEIYWGKPITGYGDSIAKLLMIGLAPAAHGGNRTGRVFTGDQSSDFLFGKPISFSFSSAFIARLGIKLVF
jgi:uracil-DNA glycosylase